MPVYKLWGLDPAKAPLSSFTIAIAANDDELRERVAQAAAYPVLKIKLGTDRDEQIIRTVREAAPDKMLRVDANAAWIAKHALAMIDVLVECGVEYVEQPVAAHDIDGLRFVRERSALPVIADESCVVATDIPRLVGVVDGINIKLSKCGGLREALRDDRDRARARHARHGRLHDRDEPRHHRGRALCAAARLRRLRWCGVCCRDDPYVGATIDGGRIAIPTAPGLGVRGGLTAQAAPAGAGARRRPRTSLGSPAAFIAASSLRSRVAVGRSVARCGLRCR